MIKYRYLLLYLFICLGGGSAFAASPSLSLTNPDMLKYPQLHFKPPQAERVALNNGMILYMLEDHELPLVNIQAVIKTGSYFDPDGKEGLAELTGMVMRTGGSETMSGSSIDETLESLAINLIISTQMESTALSFSSLKNHVDMGMKILSQVMMQPAFTEGKLHLAKNLKMEELRRIADDPQQLTFREFNRIIYRGSPRGRLASVPSIDNIERSDIVRFYKRFFYPGNILIAVTGDITKNETIALFEKYFGAWQNKGVVEEIPPPDTKLKGGVYHLSKDTPQSVIITGKFAPAKNNPDYYPFTVLDFILGSGGFRSRIFQKIRTNQGLAYSAGSFYRAKSSYGVFGTYAMTKSATTGKVLSLLRSIAEGVKMEAINSAELDWAINSINNSFIFSFGSTEQVARQQLMLEVEKLPRDHLLKYQDRIKETGSGDIKRTVSKYLTSTETVILVTGKESDFDQPLADFGKVENLSVND
jgi:zinc protease